MGKVEEKDNKEVKERETWTNPVDFVLSVIGYAVGLGNVWRFPYRAYQNGGASFLIPYVIVLTFAGLPLFFLEMAVGQFASLGPISLWKLAPVFKGIGWGFVLVCFFTSIYYNMIIAWTLYYFFASMTSQVPWQYCREEWKELGCWDRTAANATILRNLTDQWCQDQFQNNLTDSWDYKTNCTIKPKSPSELYWDRVVLGRDERMGEGGGGLKWDLTLCLLLAWVIVFLCLCKGIKSSGKVVYVTAIFPYVVLVILLIWNAQLEGAITGIKFYIIPDWSRLKDGQVWYAAGTQIFFSLGVGFGGLQTMASYNKFHNNVYRDAVMVALINCGTSVFAGFVIFSVVGFMATKTGLPVGDVVAGGPGLAFIAYPEGLTLMPVTPLWSILFFLMLFSLGVDSQFTQVETIVTAIHDEFPIFQKGHRKTLLILAMSILMFLFGLPLCCREGIYVFSLFDNYSAGLNVVILCAIEIVGISYVYGIWRFCDDIKMMIGHRPNYYWIACWFALTPILLIFLFIFSIIQSSPVSYGNYVLPRWADGAIGWLIFSLPIAAVIAMAIYQAITFKNEGKEMRDLVRPADDWGPTLDEHRTGIYSHMQRKQSTDPVTSSVPHENGNGSWFKSTSYNVQEAMKAQSYDNATYISEQD